MPKVSVIIPVYGVEKYIERCARSLFEQTLDDIEYIFVDDCTPDRSIEILKSIIEEYRLRFAEEKKVVRIERMPTNSGQAAVRRHGIQLATGDYIIHCDSDDWVDVDMYRTMYEKVVEDEADVVICDYYTHNGESVIQKYSINKPLDKLELLKEMMYLNISWAVWNKMVKSSISKEISCFPAGAMGEDMVLSLQVILKSNRISYINKPFYYYYMNASSICHKSTSEAVLNKFSQYYNNLIIVKDFLEESPLANELNKGLHCIEYSVKSMLYSSDKAVREKRKVLFPFVEFKVLFYPEISKKRRKKIVNNIIGSILNLK